MTYGANSEMLLTRPTDTKLNEARSREQPDILDFLQLETIVTFEPFLPACLVLPAVCMLVGVGNARQQQLHECAAAGK